MADQLSGGVELLDEVADALPPGVVDLLVLLLRLRLLTVRVLGGHEGSSVVIARSWHQEQVKFAVSSRTGDT